MAGIHTARRLPNHVEPLRYAPGLDGVRAPAVPAVFAYHLGGDVLIGGFLGVDVFFVLSGYLITSLLVAKLSGPGGSSCATSICVELVACYPPCTP